MKIKGKLKMNSNLQGLDEAKHNVGCLEQNNITVNTKRLGDSLKDYLVEKGVKFTYGKEVRLIHENNKIQYVQDGDTIIKGITKYPFWLLISYFTYLFSPILNFTLHS